jgi:hypothetical protein
MSAWPVPDKDIDCLAYWISFLGLSKRGHTSIGRELRAENYKRAPVYHYSTPKVNESKGYDPYDLGQALKTVHFYDYQSCEHMGAWEKSQSYRWMQKLEKYLEIQGADWQREGLLWGVYA